MIDTPERVQMGGINHQGFDPLQDMFATRENPKILCAVAAHRSCAVRGELIVCDSLGSALRSQLPCELKTADDRRKIDFIAGRRCALLACREIGPYPRHGPSVWSGPSRTLAGSPPARSHTVNTEFVSGWTYEGRFERSDRYVHTGVELLYSEQFPPLQQSAGNGFGKETIAGTRCNGRDAPAAIFHAGRRHRPTVSRSLGR